MATYTAAGHGIGTSTELSARMAKLEDALKRSSRGAGRSAGLTLAVGLLVLGLLSAYFVYGYQQFALLLTPKAVVDAAEGTLETQAPQVRGYLEGLIKENANDWAEVASTALVDTTPSLRQVALAQSVTAYDDMMVKGQVENKKVIERFVADNRKFIRDGVMQLSSDPRSAEKFINDVAVMFGKASEVELGQVVDRVVGFVNGFTELMETTRETNTKLTKLQLMQRDILMLFKRGLMDHTPTADGVPAQPGRGPQAVRGIRLTPPVRRAGQEAAPVPKS